MVGPAPFTAYPPKNQQLAVPPSSTFSRIIDLKKWNSEMLRGTKGGTANPHLFALFLLLLQ
jgi:hypothetical protein